jgi:hypothetical protein
MPGGVALGAVDRLREEPAFYFCESFNASTGAASSSDVKSPSSVVSKVASLPSFDGPTSINVFPSRKADLSLPTFQLERFEPFARNSNV